MNQVGRKQHHIMLLFLSDVKTKILDKNSGRRGLSPAYYKKIGATFTTNESAVRYLLQDTWQGEPIKHLDHMFLFVSKKVRDESKGVEAEGVEKVVMEGGARNPTHLEFFYRRIDSKELHDKLEGAIDQQTEYKYNEDLPVPYIIEMTADVSHRILKYRQRYPQDEVVLHVDCTGGHRHANMIMMNVVRLLQYRGITFGHMYYSNYIPQTETEGEREPKSFVEDASEIYRMVDVVAGAEEFVRFGSIAALQKYFEGRKKSPELQSLLRAMNLFAEEIKLCHKKKFEQAINGLRIALHDFSGKYKEWQEVSAASDSEEMRNDKLMLLLEQRMLADYAPLLEENRDDMTTIRWCLEHDYLQQAITLYTETLPDYLFHTKKLVCLSQKLDEELVTWNKKEPVYGKYYYFLNKFFQKRKQGKESSEPRPEMDKTIKAFQKEIRQSWLTDIQKSRRTVDEVADLAQGWVSGHPHCYLANYREFRQKLRELGQLTARPELLMESPLPFEWAETVVQRREEACREGKKGGAPWQDMAQSERLKEFYRFLREAPVKKKKQSGALNSFFGELRQNYAYPLLSLMREEPSSVELRGPMTETVLMDILNTYMLLKKERNTENHAKEEAGPFDTAEKLKSYLSRAVSTLEEL